MMSNENTEKVFPASAGVYLSRIQLDSEKRDTVRALQNRELLHGAIERSVPGSRPHILWRIEPDMSLLAVSRDIPYLGNIQKQFGLDRVMPASRPYHEYVASFKAGQLVRFKITVNPVINKKNGTKNGKDIPLNLRKTSAHPFCAEDWMRKKFMENGASIIDIRDVSHETAYFIKNGRRNPIFTVTYAGTLRITDRVLFAEAMKRGIGGKRTYGCGLLTVTPVKPAHSGC